MNAILTEHRGTRAWEAVLQVLNAHYHQRDIEAIRVVYASAAAHSLQGSPVWPMLVGPRGSITEILNSLSGLERVHFVDQITPKTFLSGQIETRANSAPPGMLHRIGTSGILVRKDFFLAINRNDRPSVFSQLRVIYDGHIAGHYGTSENPDPHWEGRVTFLAGATQDIDRHSSFFRLLRERFVMVRWTRPGGTDAPLRALNQDQRVAKAALKSAVQALVQSMTQRIEPQVSDEMVHKIAALGEFTVRARTHVPRDPRTREIELFPEIESNTRLPQQLCQLTNGSAMIGGRAIATDEDYAVAKRAAFDCIPLRGGG